MRLLIVIYNLFLMTSILIIPNGYNLQNMKTNEYLVGATIEFWVQDIWKANNQLDDDNDGKIDFSDNDYDEAIYQIETEIVNVSSKVVICLDKALPIGLFRANTIKLAQEFKSITTRLETIFPPLPDVDKDNHIFLVITDIRDYPYYLDGGSSVLGFFWPVHSTSKTTSGIRQYSQECEIIYLDRSFFDKGTLSSLYEITSHELQHLIQFAYHPDQDLWLDEGLSVQTQIMCGYDYYASQYREAFYDDPKKSLIYFDQSMAAYGFSALFIQYLLDHFDNTIISKIYSVSDIGMKGILQSLQSLGYSSVTSSQLVVNFTIALCLNSPTNHWYNFTSLSMQTLRPQTISTFPIYSSWSLPSWGSALFHITHLPNTSSLHISFNTSCVFDSLNIPNIFYLTIVQECENYDLIIDSWLIDPVTGKNDVLFAPSDSSTKTLVIINSLSNSLGASVPTFSTPSLNGTILFLPYEEKLFRFPGYITISSEQKELLVTGIRYYSDGVKQWTGSNTVIAKWYLYEGTIDNFTTTGLKGDLIWSPSGWFVPVFPINTLTVDTHYLFEFEFYNGSLTTSFYSDSFQISDFFSEEKGVDFTIFVLFIPLGAVLIVIFYFVVRFKSKYSILDAERVHLTSLKPQYFGKEKKSVDQVRKEIFAKRRRK